MRNVDFYYSIGSRYSYLVSTQLASLERETPCRLTWQPLNSVALMERRGANPFNGFPVSGQYDWSYRELDAKRWAALYRVPFCEPRGRVHFDPQLLALAATAAKRLGSVVAYSHELFAAMFIDAPREIDVSECVHRAEVCGISGEAFREELASISTSEELAATTERALAAGVFGVPSFVADAELFWGNDRLVLLRNHLASSLPKT
jgi:2-hydroxychromene-2-carboxylate isomerase